MPVKSLERKGKCTLGETSERILFGLKVPREVSSPVATESIVQHVSRQRQQAVPRWQKRNAI